MNFTKTRKCRNADFQDYREANENFKFYPLDDSYQFDVANFLANFTCLDDESLEIYGSDKLKPRQILQITFEQCDTDIRDDCKSQAEIDKWIK